MRNNIIIQKNAKENTIYCTYMVYKDNKIYSVTKALLLYWVCRD